MRLRQAVFAVALAGLCAGSSGLAAEETPPPARPAERPCSRPEARQFDFWVGDWDLTWGKDNKGTNSIKRAFDGCVIQENFSGGASQPLRGMSLSVWNAQIGKWQQTWVDNEGSYLDFTGEFADGRMTLQRKATLQGKEVLQRMVWRDIQPNSMMWDWERSDDGGATWKVQWQIAYRRRASGPRS